MLAERVKAERRPTATELLTGTGVSGCYNTTDVYAELARRRLTNEGTQTSRNVAKLNVLAAANGSNLSARN